MILRYSPTGLEASSTSRIGSNGSRWIRATRSISLMRRRACLYIRSQAPPQSARASVMSCSEISPLISFRLPAMRGVWRRRTEPHSAGASSLSDTGGSRSSR